ncbi:YceI family protein [Olivibacter sp. XZL3]|uniref:YceI family protein n=1 Tax=Olivibacter sp. XZL3 TaxID=1735116 RepID=UPI0010656528|nr:YceI family protein [Olivibacter sp. XZL3]
MTKWEIDTKHSEIHFKVKHMLISTVTGLFTTFEGTVDTEKPDSFAHASVYLTIDTNSVYTNEAYRDDHLKSSSFFDVAQYPHITFRSTSLEPKDKDGEFILKGMLTIKDVTNEITLLAVFGGMAEEKNTTKAGFQVSGTLNRRHFGLSYNPLMEAGGMVLSEEIALIADVELIKRS